MNILSKMCILYCLVLLNSVLFNLVCFHNVTLVKLSFQFRYVFYLFVSVALICLVLYLRKIIL